MSDLHVISLGAGVQSSTMALMAAEGLLSPLPAAAVFADTQCEPRDVYRWLDELEKRLPFPVLRVTRGSLWDSVVDVRVSSAGNRYLKTSIPVYIRNPDGSIGMAKRQCTRDFKVDVVRKAVRELRDEHAVERVVMWIGISTDESHRCRESDVDWIENRYPLLEARISRGDCVAWLDRRGFRSVPRSACVFCPYRSDDAWRSLSKDEFDDVCEKERMLQRLYAEVGMRGVPFFHKECVPIGTVSFGEHQLDMFAEEGMNLECEGMCGV